MVHGPGHEVHRHHVGLAALGPGQREPLGQRRAQPLEQLEQVVGTVDLVHLAGLGVTEHDRGPEDDLLRLHQLADQLLGLVLRPVVVVGQALPLVEHVLLEDAAVVAGHGDRARVVEAAHLVLVGELDHVTGAVHVGPLRGLLVGLHVVHGGEMEEVVDRLVEALDAQAGLRQVPGHRDDPALGGAEPLDERVELPAGALADEHVDRAVPLQELGHEVPAHEAGRSGYEVVQVTSTRSPGCGARRVYPAGLRAGSTVAPRASVLVRLEPRSVPGGLARGSRQPDPQTGRGARGSVHGHPPALGGERA